MVTVWGERRLLGVWVCEEGTFSRWREESKSWNLQGPFLLGRWTISLFCFFLWTPDYILPLDFGPHLFFLLPFGITDYFSFSPLSGLCIIFVMFRLPPDPNFLRCSHAFTLFT